ncbi:MAG TPA: hypothetical protein VHS03_06155 [Gaiellaceae bacterium]|jgi:hypothetical protein|nr:hypothetical protein [Gaiellaceae bacterium]
MQITTQVTLESGDAFAYTADAAAEQVLAALGGNPTNDHSTVAIYTQQTGSAGTPPPPPGVPELPES